jgi:hypothetical protein
MTRPLALGILLVALALPLAAAEYEQLLLPVSPSVLYCAYESRYETRLLAFNDHDVAGSRFCAEGVCRNLEPKTGAEITGADVGGGVPLPVWMYVPKEMAAKMRMSLVVEASDRNHLDARGFTELPIVRASDFTDGKLSLIGLRMDPGFRQTVRMFGLDAAQSGWVMMKVYSLTSNNMLFDWPFYIGPLTNEVTAEGLPLRPAFGMECDMSAYLHSYGQQVRIELEPITPGLKYWAFVTVTNNVTQHFYTVLPK